VTPDDVRADVGLCAGLAGDDEIAHSEEDHLHLSVLEAIAGAASATDPAECARIALSTREILFARWRA
jgi:hypothetical protein